MNGIDVLHRPKRSVPEPVGHDLFSIGRADAWKEREFVRRGAVEIHSRPAVVDGHEGADGESEEEKPQKGKDEH